MNRCGLGPCARKACPGFDTDNQMPKDINYMQGTVRYGSEPDVVAEDCKERAL